MKAKCAQGSAFSLVEVVVALGLFSFCIAAITGLLSVGLGSTRSVVNEGTAVNIASSVFGAWEAQESKQAQLTVPGLFTNLPALSSSTTNDFYFDSSGVQVDGPGGAALEMSYATTAAGQAPAINTRVDLTFRWPVGGAPNAVQTRSFTRVFVK
jgi:uncharacterized protein (TIGR02598 family)